MYSGVLSPQTLWNDYKTTLMSSYTIRYLYLMVWEDNSYCLSFPNTALPRRNGTSVGAVGGMMQEGADTLGDFRTQDMLKGAGIGFQLLLVLHVKSVGKEPLGETVTPDDAGGALPALVRHLQSRPVGPQ